LKEEKPSDLAESEKSKATPKPEPVYWNGAQAEVAAFMQLTNLAKDPEGAFARLRKRIPQWTDEQRQLFMQQLPRNYHNLAFGAAMGADYSLEWVPSYSISKSAPLAGTQQMYDWLYRNGPEPKRCNCWEAVYFAAYRVGKINKQRIKALLPNPNRDSRYPVHHPAKSSFLWDIHLVGKRSSGVIVRSPSQNSTAKID
jgi:hypothetical protein